MHFTQSYDSPVGKLTLASDGESLTGLWLEGQKYFGSGLELAPGEAPALEQAKRWLDRYFSGEQPSPKELSLNPQGTQFQRRVWALLREIPFGQTTTYGELAERLNSAPRAVGSAVGKNPISIVIPCHRVLGANGSLTGYAGGIARKQWLLAHEAIGNNPPQLP